MTATFIDRIKQYRYAEVLRICLPLVMSTAAVTVMEFTDRVFLSNYSLNAIAAAPPAGILAFLFTLFFSGITGYGTVLSLSISAAGPIIEWEASSGRPFISPQPQVLFWRYFLCWPDPSSGSVVIPSKFSGWKSYILVFSAWICTTLFITSLFVITLLRYLQGKWLDMRVVEKQTIRP